MIVTIGLICVVLVVILIFISDVGTDEWRIEYKRGLYVLERKNILGFWCERWSGFTEEEVKEAERRFTSGKSQEYL